MANANVNLPINFENNWIDGQVRMQLPIDGRLNEIVALWRDDQVVIVEAETGAGKTTRIPQAITLARPQESVLVTSLRRNAVRSIARRMAEEMGQEPGEQIGWRLAARAGKGEDVTSAATRVTMVVDQSLANRIVREGRLPEGTLIVDEAHDRNVAIDLTLGLIKRYLPQSPKTRVIVTSATIDTDKFSAFFDGAPVIKVAGRVFPVETRLLQLDRHEHHTQGAARAASRVLADWKAGTLSVGEEPVREGTVLVLLPGKQDIDAVVGALQSRVGEEDPVEVLALFGGSTPEADARVQRPVPKGTLRFVVATEVLRSQRTAADVVGVIDSLQIKRMMTDKNGVGHLAKISVSRAEAEQAKGRAGRTQEGFYIPVCFGREFESLEAYPQPAILREPISSVVLQLAASGVSARTFEFIDAPEAEHISAAIARLQKMGALDEAETITELGRLLLSFPVDPERALVLVQADRLGVLPEAIVAMAIEECEGILHRQRYGVDALRKVRAEYAAEDGDFAANVRMYRAWVKKRAELRKDARQAGKKDYERKNWQQRLRAWCDSQHLNAKRIQLVEGTIGQIREEVQTSDLTLEADPNQDRVFDPIALTKAMMTGLVDFVLVLQRDRSGYYRYIGPVGSVEIGDTSLSEGGQFVLVARPRKIPARKGGFIQLSDSVVALEEAWLKEMLPQLLRVETGQKPRFDQGLGGVVSDTVTSFNELEIKRETALDPRHPEAPRLLDEEAWRSWKRPEMALPDCRAEPCPPLCGRVYCTSRVSGEPLIAYGHISFVFSREPSLRWTNDQDEAKRKQAEGAIAWKAWQTFWANERQWQADIEVLNARREQFGLGALSFSDLRPTLRNDAVVFDDWDQQVRNVAYREEERERQAEQHALAEAMAKAKAEAEAEAEALARRREAAEAAIEALKPHEFEAYVWVPATIKVAYVFGGKTSKMGTFVVTPPASAFGRPAEVPYLFGDYKYSHWVPFKYGVVSVARDYSSSGNLQHEVELRLEWDMLESGVYAVGCDEEGQYFVPYIYHGADGEVIPELEEIQKLRMPAPETAMAVQLQGAKSRQDDATPEKKRRKKSHRVQSNGDEATRVVDSGVDPDNPFAKLAALKAQLEKDKK